MKLLDYLQADRRDIADLMPPANPEREKFISEIMRPAKTTDKWRDIAAAEIHHEAYDGIRLIDCDDVRKEALAIALIMRETLEQPEKTAALVTTDRNLARRVASELRRWKINIDDSAGQPLALTPIGIFLRQMTAAAKSDFAPVEFLSLLKLPLLTAGLTHAEIRRLVRDYEKRVLRGGGYDEISEEKVNAVKAQMQAFCALLQQPKADFKTLLELHVRAAEKLAAQPGESGASTLWKGDAGEAMAGFVADLYQSAGVLGEVDTAEYEGLFESLMAGVTVRPKYGTHPRLRILGPIEARADAF